MQLNTQYYESGQIKPLLGSQGDTQILDTPAQFIHENNEWIPTYRPSTLYITKQETKSILCSEDGGRIFHRNAG